jgi:hypothetical protein
MSTPPATGTTAPVTYPHLGTALVAVGVGAASFSSAAGPALGTTAKGILDGIAAAASAVGLFLLGRASI